MKTFAKIFTLIAVIVAVAFAVNAKTAKTEIPAENLYPLSAVVVSLDEENDIVAVEDCVGFVWEFTGIEDWSVGDGCSMIMNNNGTNVIFDDEIVVVHYERFDLLMNK